jgi:hypothetical protein
MANQERKLKNNIMTLEKDTVARLVNINRQADLTRDNNHKIEQLSKEYFSKLKTLMGLS